MTGGAGNDTYVVLNTNDAVVEAVGQGNDVVYANVSWALSAGSSVETVSAIDWSQTTALNLTGNELANTIYGNAGANFLNGNGGGDTMFGFGGDDIYVVNAPGDTIVETAGHGFDVAYINTSSYTLTAGSAVEWLSGISWALTTPLSLTGNELAQSLYGNAGDNHLNGNGGGDILYGFGGNDVFVVGDAADLVFETAGNGFDVVYVNTPSYVLGLGSEVELLSAIDWTLTSALSITGNELAQSIYGNAGDDFLDGGGGDDLLAGLGGADTFAFTTALGSDNIDTILDFTSGTDKIALAHAVFEALSGHSLTPGQLFVGSAAIQEDQRIIYDQAQGLLYYDADGVGGADGIAFAYVHPGTIITANDFTII